MLLFWPEINALGVFLNFNNKRMYPLNTECGRCMDRALISTWGRVKGQIEGKWVGVA